MGFGPENYNRKSIRLRGFDYTRDGAYFVTIRAHACACSFGTLEAGQVRPNAVGAMIVKAWNDLPDRYPGVHIDAFALMPDHIHGIIILAHSSGKVRRGHPLSFDQEIPFSPKRVSSQSGPIRDRGKSDDNRLSLLDVVHRFKSWTTKLYREEAKSMPWPYNRGKLWQRNFWDRFITSELQLERVRQYIHFNPSRYRR